MTNDFAYPASPEQPGIWTISADSLTPQLAYEIPPQHPSWVFVSSDGMTLLRFEKTDIDREEAVFYDIASREEVRVPVDSGMVLRFDWLPDGRFRYLTEVERIQNVGERRKFVILDPRTQQSETLVEELNLPGYLFDPNELLPSGYDAADPTGELVLYTARAEEGVDIVLLNHQTGAIIWQHKAEGLPASPSQAEWSTDGSRVLFVMHISAEGSKYRKIVSLTHNGQVEQLPPQPYPSLNENIVRYLTRSPDGRYIVYGVWESARRGPGFVVDTATSEVGEICDTGTTFVDGQWISNNQFVYRVLVKEGENWRHSLRILDVPTWTTQILFESSPGYGINIFGWTPFEFPQR